MVANNLRNIFSGGRRAANQDPAETQTNAKKTVDTKFFTRCRTRRVTKKDGVANNASWLEASRISQTGRWLLSKIEERPNIGTVDTLPDDMLIRKNEYQEIITFGDVISRMAAFENGLMEDEVFTGESKEQLGDQHYEAVALKEGIGLDVSGMPRPVINGTLLTSGYYTPEMAENAVKAESWREENTEAAMKEVSLLDIAATLGSDDLLTAIHNKFYLRSFVEQIEDVHKSFKRIARDRDSGMERFLDTDDFFIRPARQRGRYSDNYATGVGQKLNDIRIEIEGWKDDVPLYKAMSLFHWEYTLFVLTAILKDAYETTSIIYDNDDKAEMKRTINQNLKTFIQGVCDQLVKDGADPTAIKNYKNLVLLKDSKEAAADIDAVLKRMRKDYDSLSTLSVAQYQHLTNGAGLDLFSQLNTAGVAAPAAPRGNSNEANPSYSSVYIARTSKNKNPGC